MRTYEDHLLEILGIETFETRKSDHLDIHEIAVWQLVEAIDAAYYQGYANAQVGHGIIELGDKYNG